MHFLVPLCHIFTNIMIKRPLILISNDDGVGAQGIEVLTRIMRTLGDVFVVAPDSARSAASCSITPREPVRAKLLQQEEGLTIYSCSGTPCDCVKLAFEQLLPRTPDLMVSGINHGDNASVNVHYSGTMGATLEACLHDVPAIGYSLCSHDTQCDFTPYEDTIAAIAQRVLRDSLPQDVCLNVNFPVVERLAGVRICRQCRCRWKKEWVPAEEPNSYRLTGYCINMEPEAEDTDRWALDHGYASIVPTTLDLTAPLQSFSFE